MKTNIFYNYAYRGYQKMLSHIILVLLFGIGCFIQKAEAGNFTISGATLTIDLDVANQIVSVASTGTTYTFTLSGGSSNTWTGTTNTSVTVSGSVLTVTATGVTTFTNISISDSQSGNGVTFSNSGTNNYVCNINVTLDNSPGAVTFNGFSSFSDANTINVTTSKHINFATSSSLSTVNGNLTLLANTQSVPNDFPYSGIKVDSATIQVSGTGILTMKGRGGSSGASSTFNNRGIAIINGSLVKGGTSGTTIIEGKGFTGVSSTNTYSNGVSVNAKADGTATLTTNGSNISVTGYGANSTAAGISTQLNCGVSIGSYNVLTGGGIISAGGSGTVTITGYGGTCANPSTAVSAGMMGVLLFGNAAQITSGGGDVVVTGTGGGSDTLTDGNMGVALYRSALITAGTNGNVNVTGTGGNSKGTLAGALGNNGIFFSNFSGTLPAAIRCAAGTGNVLVTGTGGGGFGKGVDVYTVASISSLGSGTVTVIGYGAPSGTAIGNTGVIFRGTGNPCSISSNGGNVRVEGYGGGILTSSGNIGVSLLTGGTLSAGGMGTTTVIGVGSNNVTGSTNYGVYVSSNGSNQNESIITSAGGDVIVTGTGGGGTSATAANASGSNYGVTCDQGGSISAGGNGSVTITGIGGGNSTGGTGSSNHGVYLGPYTLRGTSALYSTVITSGGGNITITGTGGCNNGNGTSNNGIQNYGLIKPTGAGTLTITGTGGGATGTSNYGVANSNTATVLTVVYPATITSEGGNVSITGNGGGTGSSSNNHGVYVNSGGIITTGINGALTITGNGGTNPTGNTNYGIYVTGASNPYFSTITTGGGNLSATGKGGGSGSSAQNHGIYLNSGGVLSAGGSGTVLVRGTGGINNTGGTNYGIYANGGVGTKFSTITSGGGNVDVMGIGGGSGATTLGSNIGVHLNGGAIITAGGTASVLVLGKGSQGVPANNSNGSNHGLYINAGTSPNFSMITSGGGNVEAVGIGSSFGSSTNFNSGTYCNAGGTITSGGSGNVKVTGVAFNFGQGVYVKGSISSGGSGTVLVTGTGGIGTISAGSTATITNCQGIRVADGKITSGGGDVTCDARSTGGIRLENGTSNPGVITTAVNGGNITLKLNNYVAYTTTTGSNFVGSVSAKDTCSVNFIPSDGSTVYFTPNISGNSSLDDLLNSNFLAFQSQEMPSITGGNINIGDTNTLLINIKEPIVPSSGSNFKLSGSALSPKVDGTEITIASGKILDLTGVKAFNIEINGTTVNTQYDQLKVVANLDITNKVLNLSGTYVPVGCDVFTIVDATNITGTFSGLANGSTLTFNGRTLIINYTATQVTLTDPSPNIVSSPNAITLLSGNTASFVASFCGTPTPTIQWQVSTNGGTTWSNLSGENSGTLSIITMVAQNQYQYRAVSTNIYGTAITNAVVLTVYEAPIVITQPMNTTVVEGATASFTLSASGTPLPTVQWQVSTDGGLSWSDITGSNSTTIMINTSLSQNGNLYHAVVSNIAGSLTTNSATLTVTNACTPTSYTENITACSSYNWHGTYYTSSNNTATWMGTNASGCDSMVTLNLTINQPSTTSTTISNCGAYSWNGQSYTSSGTYSWTGTNAVGCDSISILVLTVKQATSSTTNISAAGSYTWNGNTYYMSGTYIWTGINAAGCDSVATLVLSITATNISNVCPYIGTGETLTYTTSLSGGGSYTWSLPANTQLISGQGTQSIQIKILNGFASTANKQIRVTQQLRGGSMQIIYLAAQAPITPAAITASSSNVCASLGTNVPITYTIPKAYAAVSYIWTAQNGTTNISSINGNGVNDTAVSVTFTSNFTSSNITVQSVNDCGVSGSRSLLISRNTPSQPGLISGPANACEYAGETGQTATYTVPAVAGADSYSWSLPNGVFAVTGQGTRSVSFKYPANFISGTIVVTVSNGCGISAARSLNISRLQAGTPSIIDVINTGICPARTYTYTLSSMPTNATSVFWTVPAGGTIVSGQGTSSITVSYTGAIISGEVKAKGVNNCSVSGERISSVKLPACPAGGVAPGTYTKGNATLQSEEMDVQVYPNPSSTSFKLNVLGSNQTTSKVSVLDMQGRMICSYSVSPQTTLNLGNNLKPGTYMVEVRKGEEVKTVKVVKY